ncbi:MAG TPA: acyl-CoA dehydrogenase family protein [Streptosporangiaceae bacterium]|nr:acyl-CoA dehydrogenase family protein [Streptosporangiaceae bacterium]
MDFRLSDEQEMFRKSLRDYVNRELPKSWARDLEKDEHTFPHELFGKLATAGFHAIGIPEEYGGQGGDIMTQMLLARELARSLAGLTWVWGITSFAGGKSVGIYGTPEQKQQHLPASSSSPGRRSPSRRSSTSARVRSRPSGCRATSASSPSGPCPAPRSRKPSCGR